MKEIKKDVTEIKKEEPVPEKLTVPYIPNDIDTDDDIRNMYIRKFITKIQTPKKNEPDHTRETLLTAVKIGISLEKGIYDEMKTDNDRKTKFETIIGVLIAQPDFRGQLLSGELKPSAMIKMGKEDFISSERKKAQAQGKEAKMQAQRTDWARAEDKKGPIPDGLFTCKRCKSKKTTFYQQQTRGADEPMTNFIQCLMCNYNMKS